MRVEYESNNSGGGWWLTDEDWKALEAAGWRVRWYTEIGVYARELDPDGRWMKALASSADREGLSMRDAIDEWERVTSGYSADLGCNCCGPPHRFTAYDDDGKLTECWSPDYPEQGEPYR